MSKQWKSLGIAIASLGAAVYLAADSEKADAGHPQDLMKRVETAIVEATHDSRELRFSGTTRAVQRARMAFSVGGRMQSRPVEVGDRVRRGQLLARLDQLGQTNAVASAQAALAELTARRAQSERDSARAEKLAAAKAATAEELERTAASVDALRAAEKAARARLEEAERQLDITHLRAPFDGVVTDVLIEPGEYASAGSPVVLISGDGSLELEVEVPESVIPQIATGDEVGVRVPVLGDRELRGQILSIGRTAAGPGRLFPVIVSVPSQGDRIVGATAELRLEINSDQALSLPIAAVVNPGGRRPVVFRVADAGDGTSTTQKVPVEVGDLTDDGEGPVRVVVRGDLAVGDRVVSGGQRGLLDGETVLVTAGNTESTL